MRVLVVTAHPDDSSFVAALVRSVVFTLQRRGHEVDLFDLYASGFEPVLSADERRLHLEDVAAKPQLVPHAERLRRADALVLVYPTMWGGPPAMLKGWLDRVWGEGVAFTMPPGAKAPKPLLRNIRRMLVVTTYGSSRWVNAVQGEPGRRIWRRSVRLQVNPWTRCGWLGVYDLDRSGPLDRARAIRRVERRLTRW